MADNPLTEVPILILGESHSTAISRSIEIDDDARFVSIDVRTGGGESKINFELFNFYKPDKLVLAFGGTEYNIIGMIEGEPKFDFLWPPYDDLDTERTLVPASAIEEMLNLRIPSGLRRALRAREQFDCPVYALAPPPPFLAVDEKAALPKAFAALLEKGIAPAPIRRKLYAVQCAIMQSLYEKHGIPFINAPRKACDKDGFLLRKMWGRDPTHGNQYYGRIVTQHLTRELESTSGAFKRKPLETKRETRRHPYVGKPDYQFWRKEPGLAEIALFDPVGKPTFGIDPNDKVVTAGSCFAQHVARFLAETGFNFLVTEQPHSVLSDPVASKLNYGLFSARYGNIYTTRQLRQLLERAYGAFQPIDGAWQREDGRWIDPFRPQILPGGYASPREVELDREIHFAAVRRAVEEMSVFVFTLGLTESWLDSRDGAAYPLAPGVAGGIYDESIHEFRNFDVGEVAADLQWSLDFIRSRNPAVKFILTVSPVPLNATALDRHVAVSTGYSKSVLRVVAEQVCNTNTLCDYFPSYEIITSPITRGAYFEDDAREIRSEGVHHVMSLFLKHYADLQTGTPAATKPPLPQKSKKAPNRTEQAEALMQVLCDEEAIDNT